MPRGFLVPTEAYQELHGASSVFQGGGVESFNDSHLKRLD